ncbi:hypothetical protein FBEOM_12962 [Fusarium beomiforme]|uniref:Uncharacterized protein n=1 Tax=Fusarium beomiforme TaxID=44412 RepID=A0A9P5A6S2_9HYPO|nr:hypothetical protein FBEOM_12962 [Fusarium beomiforme]
MNEYGTGSGTKKLFTHSLATCVRVAIVGTYPAGRSGDDRFLAHIPDVKPRAALQGLINSVNAAKRNGMVIDKARVVVGDFHENSGHDSDDPVMKAKEEGQDGFCQIVGSSIMALVGDSTKVKRKTHAEKKPYHLEITGAKEIKFKLEGGNHWEDSDTESESEG